MNKRQKKILQLVGSGIGVLFVLSLFVMVAFVAWINYAYDVNKLTTEYPTIVWKKSNKTYDISLRKNKPWSWTRIDQISQYAIGAVIVSEDWKFFNHSGIDFKELHRAFVQNLEEKRYARGASTITQQVAKNVFLSKEKSLWRKFKELLITMEMERELSKEKILEIYFNIVEWGNGIYGIKAAAGYYFSKPPSAIEPKEAAFLAMLLPSPRKYSVSFHQQKLTPYAKKTIEAILVKMAQAGYLDKQSASAFGIEPLIFESAANSPTF